jgi:dihydroflavonol-4-reductase
MEGNVTIGAAFVTGSTGLLGNNLVRELVAAGTPVRALARSREKATRQFGDLNAVEIVEGDMTNVTGFADALGGVDVLFHTAAFFRDNYTGGSHWEELHKVNVEGTRAVLQAAYDRGIRRVVYTSSIAVLDGPKGAHVNETMLRDEANADDYYRSKILAEREVIAFLQSHPDMHATIVLPGWMHGPGDAGPTSAGQFTLDFVRRRLAGIIPATFSVVDARDVAAAMISAAERGRRGERYLAAGRYMTMAEIVKVYERVSGVKAPTRKVPLFLLWPMAAASEAFARVSGRKVLLSLASVRLILREGERTRFDHSKSERELGLIFRPVEQTLRDEIDWYRVHGWLPAAQKPHRPTGFAASAA